MENDNLPDWIKDSITDLTKAYKNRLRVHRIRKIVRIFNIDVIKL
jgi:hypothetical protein